VTASPSRRSTSRSRSLVAFQIEKTLGLDRRQFAAKFRAAGVQFSPQKNTFAEMRASGLPSSPS
jgi:hypothetical protein